MRILGLLKSIHLINKKESLDMDKEADAVEAAVQKVLTEGYRTGDIMSEAVSYTHLDVYKRQGGSVQELRLQAFSPIRLL